MLKTNMTLIGKVFMVLFFMAIGFAGGLYVGNGKSFQNSGVSNSTEINIENLKAKEGSEINIDTPVNQKGEQTAPPKKEKKKFLGIF